MKPIQTEIVRSYSRKISNPSNQYENFDFFSSYKQVFEGTIGEKERQNISDKLHEAAKLDVEVEVAKWKKPDLIVRGKVKEYMEKNNLNYIE